MFTSWTARGGVLLGKINFLREVIAIYGVNTPVMLTEASLVCPEWVSECNTVGETFLEAQADHEYCSSGKRIWVLWSSTRTDSVINLLVEILNVYDKYGVSITPITPINGQITVSSPVDIELSL